MARRFLGPGLALIILAAVLGVNLWGLAQKGLVYRLPDQIYEARFCRCLADEDVCWDQDNRYSDEELRRWEELVESDPAYPDSWAKLATIWLYKGRYDLAAMTVSRAVGLAPFREDLKKLQRRIKNACG